MDINQLPPEELSRAVHQRLLAKQDFDAFVLNMLWFRLSIRTKEVLECSKTWYFGELQVSEHWRVPDLVIVFSNAALLAHPRHEENLSEIAGVCKALTRCDQLQILGGDICIRLWFDHSSQRWYRQTVQMPADWHLEES